MQEGLTPRQASDILLMFQVPNHHTPPHPVQNTFDGLWHKHVSYSVGEELFGLEHTEQAGLNIIKKELNLLQRLYKLYNDVINSVNGYSIICWKQVDVEDINNQLMDFGNR